MSDQGLSIFDNEPGSAPPEAASKSPTPDNETTQVMPVTTSAPPTSAPPAPPRPAPTGAPGASTAALPVVRRGGYDQAAVDAQIRQLASEKASLGASLTESEQRVIELEAALGAAKAELAETDNPSYAGLGGRASAMLRLAEEETEEIRGGAERDAAEIREQASRDAKAIRAEAAREAEDMRAVQLRELEENRERLLANAEQELALARSTATDELAAAKREADQLRLATQQEASELRSAVQREVEQARAGADREVQEARRMLAVEKERLAREATDHHNTAVAETRKLVDEAEQRAAAAEQRAAEASRQAAENRAAAQTESEALLSRARREAEQIVASARTQADSITASGEADAQRQLAATRAELERVSKRKSAITAQLASLADLVAGFDENDAEEQS